MTSILHSLPQHRKHQHTLLYTWPLYYIHLLNAVSADTFYPILDLYITFTCSTQEAPTYFTIILHLYITFTCSTQEAPTYFAIILHLYITFTSSTQEAPTYFTIILHLYITFTCSTQESPTYFTIILHLYITFTCSTQEAPTYFTIILHLYITFTSSTQEAPTYFTIILHLYITFTSSTQEAPTYFTIYLTSILHPLAQCCKRRHILPYTWPLYYIHLLNAVSADTFYPILDFYITFTSSTQEAPTYFTIYLTSILHPLAQCCKRRHILLYTWPLYYIHLLNAVSADTFYPILDLYITSTCSML